MAAYDFVLCGGDILLQRYNAARKIANELEELAHDLFTEGAPSVQIIAVIRMIEFYRADAKYLRDRFEKIGFVDENFAREAS